MRDIQDKTDGIGDILSSAAFNANLINELQDFVVSAGFSLDPEAGPDTDTLMFSKSVTNYAVGAQFFTESGVADAYILTRSGTLEAMSSYFDGATVLFKPTNANTGASTINVDGIGVVDLVDSAGAALTGGELTAGTYAMAVYNNSSGDFELISFGGGGGAGYALDSTVVHLAGAETITGNKLFSVSPRLSNTVYLQGKDTLSNDIDLIGVDGSNNVSIGYTFNNIVFTSIGNMTHNGNTVWTSGNDSALAHLAGAETFTGIKSFSASPILGNTILLQGEDTVAASVDLIGVNVSDQVIVGDSSYPLALLSNGTFTHNGSAIPDDSLLLHLAGAETITGQKTFAASPILNNGQYLYGKESGGTLRTLIGVHSSNYIIQGTTGIQIRFYSSITPTLNLSGGGPYDLYHTGNDTTLAHLAGTETFTGVKTFNARMVFDSTPDTDQTAIGISAVKTIDSNATGFGALLFLASDGNYDEADATDDTLMPCTAMALESGTGSKAVLKQGYVRDDTWTWTPGGLIYVSTTTGAMTQTAPSSTAEIVQIIGIAETATIIYFDPEFTFIEVA